MFYQRYAGFLFRVVIVIVGGSAVACADVDGAHADDGTHRPGASSSDAGANGPTCDGTGADGSDGAGCDGAHPDAGTGAASDGGVSDAGANASDAGVVVSDAGVVVSDGGVGALTASECFANITSQTGVAPNYDQFGPVIGSHCAGTNHQDIAGVERVVFLGDSVTVGTPPSTDTQIYRSILADRLTAKFNLAAPSTLWKSVNPLDGTASVMHSGDFWSCAKWGARVDDLMQDNSQIDDCFPQAERNKHTLLIMTMGGNDIAHITKAGADGEPVDQVQVEADAWVQRMRDAVEYLKDPAQFPGGVDVVFTNNFEFTDATGDVASCPAASASGFDKPWDDPTALARMIVGATEQYMSIAVDTHSDMVFTLETFCGHGYHNDDATNGCYRGPDTPRWFDLTCIHPNPTGHEQLADYIMDVVNE